MSHILFLKGFVFDIQGCPQRMRLQSPKLKTEYRNETRFWKPGFGNPVWETQFGKPGFGNPVWETRFRKPVIGNLVLCRQFCHSCMPSPLAPDPIQNESFNRRYQ